jgi:TonB family protein
LRTGQIQHCADTENDPLVDIEVCRSLGLRSIAVLPIQGWRGINGILEVFSTRPTAFTEQHIALLQQLAALAERARASQPHGESSSASKLPSATEKPQPSGLLPASDRVGDVALAFFGTRSRPFVMGCSALVAISLLGLVIWLGWRGPGEADAKTRAAEPVSASLANVNSTGTGSSDQLIASLRARENDPVWKPNPGGETLFTSSGKPSAGSPVKFASKVDVVAGKRVQTDRSSADRASEDRASADRPLLLADVAEKVTADVGIRHEDPTSLSGTSTSLRSSSSPSDAPVSIDPPSMPKDLANRSALSGVLSANASLSPISAPVSQGVSGGQLLHRVSPVYPAQARVMRLEGTVVLAAAIMEDGSVNDIRVVEGSPTLAQSAVEAVKHWRYKPFELDGKPVKNEIRINVDFRFPESLRH